MCKVFLLLICIIGCADCVDQYQDTDSDTNTEYDTDADTESDTENDFIQCVAKCGAWNYRLNRVETQKLVDCRVICEKTQDDTIVNDCIIDYVWDQYECFEPSIPSEYDCSEQSTRDLCACGIENDILEQIKNDICAPDLQYYC